MFLEVIREPLVFEFTCQRIHGTSGPTTEAKIMLAAPSMAAAAEEFVLILQEREKAQFEAGLR